MRDTGSPPRSARVILSLHADLRSAMTVDICDTKHFLTVVFPACT